MSDAPKIIRPSSLPSFRDCERRSAAQLFRTLIEEAGFSLRLPPISIGAHVGTAVHAVAAYSLEAKIASGGDDLGNEAEALDAGLAAFAERSETEGCRADDTTPDQSTAFKQIERMGKMYRRTLGREIRPVAVEQRLEADVGDGFIVSGQSDAVAREPERMRDLKTGVRLPAGVGIQVGTYSMLRRAHGFDDVRELTVDYLPRVAIRKDQPPPQVHVLPVDVSEHEAVETVDAMKAAVIEFERRAKHGNRPPEMAFRANPSSVLCSEKFCSAFGTPFCRSHPGAR